MPLIQAVLALPGFLAIATLGLDRRLAERELSDAVLLGDARCDAYLRGRGVVPTRVLRADSLGKNNAQSRYFRGSFGIDRDRIDL